MANPSKPKNPSAKPTGNHVAQRKKQWSGRSNATGKTLDGSTTNGQSRSYVQMLTRGGRRAKTSARRMGRRIVGTMPARGPEDGPATKAKRGRRVKLATRTAVAVGSLIVALVVYLVLVRTAPHVEPNTGGPRATKVPVISIEPVTIARPWQGMGTVQAKRQVTVPARVSATVKQVMDGVDEGERVSQGAMLVKLDESDFNENVASAQNRLEQLQAQLKQLDITKQRLTQRRDLEQQMLAVAQRNVQRLKNIYKNQAGTRQDLDSARTTMLNSQRTLSSTQENLESMPDRRAQLQAQIDAQQANLRLARLDRQRTYIDSPIDGVIDHLAVDEGENVQAGQAIATIVDLRTLEVQLNLPAAARRDIAIGADLMIHSAARPNQTWNAKITRLQPTNDPQSRTMKVYARIDQRDAQKQFGQLAGTALLTPGTFVTAGAESLRPARRWVVPRRAVGNGRIRLVKDGQIQSLPVGVDYALQRTFGQFGIQDDQWVVLEQLPDASGSGALKPGDQVVLNVATSLREGQRVKPVAKTSNTKTKQ